MTLYLATLLALWVHELGHALVGTLLDDDPLARARLTLRPLVNLDPLFSLLLPALSIWLLGVPLGCGRPFVLRDGASAATFLAGPGANLVLCVVALGPALLGSLFALQLVAISAVMAFGNLLPLPFLDMGRALFVLRRWDQIEGPPSA